VKLLPTIVAPELTGLMEAAGRFGSDSRRLRSVSRNRIDVRGLPSTSVETTSGSNCRRVSELGQKSCVVSQLKNAPICRSTPAASTTTLCLESGSYAARYRRIPNSGIGRADRAWPFQRIAELLPLSQFRLRCLCSTHPVHAPRGRCGVQHLDMPIGQELPLSRKKALTMEVHTRSAERAELLVRAGEVQSLIRQESF